MMKLSRECLVYTRRDSGEELGKIAYEVAIEARKKGLRVSVAEIVEAARLLALYTAVSGVETLTPDDIAFVLSSVYAKRTHEERIVSEIVKDLVKRRCLLRSSAKRIEDEIEKDLHILGLHYGAKLRGRNYTSGKTQGAYARLKLLGIIRRGRKGEYVVSSSQARRIIEQLANRYQDYKDAVRDMIKRNITRHGGIVASMGDELLNYIDSSELSIDELVKLYRYAGKNKHLKRIISKSIEEKVNQGEHYNDAESVYEILRKENMLSRHHLRSILERNPRLAERAAKDFGREILLDIAVEISSHNKDGAVEIALKAIGARASRRGVITEMLNRREIELLSSIGRGPNEALDVLNKLAEAKNYLLKSLVERTDASLEYAEYEFIRAAERWSRIRSQYDGKLADIVESEIARLKQLFDAAERGDSYTFMKNIVKNMDVLEALKLLHTVYNSTTDRRIRSYAIMLMKSLWREARAGYGMRLSRKSCFSSTRGRLHMRKTLENIVRFSSNPIVRTTKCSTKQYTVVVDKSGSMRPYAVYTVLAASALAASISRLIIFDENATMYSNLKRVNPLRIVDLVLSTKFAGYTDIVNALRLAAKATMPQHMVIISDLKQTIAVDGSVEEILRELRQRGWQITIILPPRHDTRMLNKIRQYARLYIIKTPQDIAPVMRRIIRS
ncbi:MAG TPA: VWA domain-containing protein [Pyrodictium delaneyi]|uniref:VWA domain-containing protein n=1 Tax=Pyrodictium delaneyi TaxID=1273541 RepID=A0A833EBD6_9CREN|nr:VWA domain-containing protein [Pyrodictium delaneyi]